MRVLVVEDNDDIAANIVEYLEVEGFTPDRAADGITGMHLALTEPYDVIVLDLMLPGIDGLTICQRLREQGNQIPVLMLTARDTLPNKLEGFRAGADDYLVKPFALQELTARLNALNVRRERASGQVLKIDDLTLDKGAFQVARAGHLLELNNICIRILRILMEQSPNVVTRDDLTWRLWQDQPPGSDALRSHVYTLRRIIDKPYPTSLIQTVRGVGYRIVPAGEAIDE